METFYLIPSNYSKHEDLVVITNELCVMPASLQTELTEDRGPAECSELGTYATLHARLSTF